MTGKAYAFRTFQPFDERWGSPVATSSAEWNEATALELGDRVSEHSFMEMMYEAYMLLPYAGEFEVTA